VSALDDEEVEPGDDMLLLDVLLVSLELVEPDVAPVPDVPAAPDVPDGGVPDGDVVDDDEEDVGVDGLIVPVVDDELELVSGGVLGVVVVVELELLAGGVLGVVVVVVLDSRLQPAMPIAAAMARTASGFAFMREILRSGMRDGSLRPMF
jgi:hypothetical protein